MRNAPIPRQDTVELFRRRLLELIRKTGLSRSAFARRVGIDRSTLSQILSDATNRLPRMETLVSIANAEQISIDWLVGLSESGSLGPEIIEQSVEIQEGSTSPADARLEMWRQEALGYKIRYVPATLPDLFKIEEVIEFEYSSSVAATPEQRQATRQANLDYQRRPETDTEVCSPLQSLVGFARGEGIWRELPAKARKRQLDRMIELLEELYPTFRWFLFDALERFSVPLTVFGPHRAVIYIGQAYLVLNSHEQIKLLAQHFDRLIRAAVVQPTGVATELKRLRDEL